MSNTGWVVVGMLENFSFLERRPPFAGNYEEMIKGEFCLVRKVEGSLKSLLPCCVDANECCACGVLMNM